MTNKEAIIHIEQIRPKKCRMVNGKLQGGFPDHDSDIGKAIDMAIEALEKQMHNCEECKHANYYDWCTLNNHLVLCREHNAMMRDDNCCRDWTPLE